MAKDLPYYKFIVAEWLLGRISHETYAIKGAFADATALFWHKECVLTCDELVKKLGARHVDKLMTLKYIAKVGDHISIPFLEEQFTEFAGLQDKRSVAGKKGRWAQLGQTPGTKKHLPGHLEERRGEEIRGEESNSIKGNFFRINDVPYLTKLSKFIPEAFPGFYDQWLSKNNIDFLPDVLEKLDTDYIGYTFNNHNHIQNTFKKVWEKVEKEFKTKKHEPTNERNSKQSNGSFGTL